MKQYLNLLQILVSILLIILILLQQRGTALGSAFGGGGSFYATKRGLEKKIFWLTCFLGFLFILLALLMIILK